MREFHFALKNTLPIFFTYLFIGIAFGILMSDAGYSVPLITASSFFIFAGSMQLVMVPMMTSGASLLSLALMAFFINARHIFYGISLIDTYKGMGKKKPYAIFALTDETYTLVTQNQPPEGMSRHSYCFFVSLLDHIYWVIGCSLGHLAASCIPISFEGVEFVLTALFVTMFVEQWLTHKDHIPAIIGVTATALCLALFGSEIFLIPSMALIAISLIVLQKTGRRKSDA